MRFTLSILFCLFAGGTFLHGMDLLKDGKYQVNAVVVSQNASRSELQAAHELRIHMAKVAKSKMPALLKDNGKLPAGKYIYLGNGVTAKKNVSLPEKMVKSYGEIVVKDGNIFICGNDAPGNWQWDISQGTLFATYEFIEKYLGVRWLWPGDLGTYIPVKKDISVPEGKTVVKPRFAASRWRIPRSVHGWASKDSAFRFQANQQLFLKRHRFSWDFGYQHGHAFTGYYKVHGKTHPEFFNMLPDGWMQQENG